MFILVFTASYSLESKVVFQSPSKLLTQKKYRKLLKNGGDGLKVIKINQKTDLYFVVTKKTKKVVGQLRKIKIRYKENKKKKIFIFGIFTRKKRAVRFQKRIKSNGILNVKIIKETRTVVYVIEKNEAFKLFNMSDLKNETSFEVKADELFYREDDNGGEAWLEWKFESRFIISDYNLDLVYMARRGVGKKLEEKIESFEGTGIETNFDQTNIKLGFHSFLWGKMDETSTFFDHVRQDYTQFMSMDLAERTIGYPGISVEYSGGIFSLGIFVVYNNKENILPDEGGNWSFFRREKKEFFGVELNDQFATILSGAGIKENEETNFDIGIKTDWSLGNTDVSFIFLKYLRPMPYFRINADFLNGYVSGIPLPVLLAEYNDQLILFDREEIMKFGVDFSTNIGANILKGEVSFLTGNFITLNNYLIEETEKIDFGLSLESDYLDGKLKMFLQANGQSILEEEELYLDQKHNLMASCELQYIIKDEVFDIKGRYVRDIKENASHFRFGSYYRPELNITLKVEYHDYRGSNLKSFGFFDDNDLFVIGLDVIF